VSCENGNNTPKEPIRNILRTPDEVVQKDEVTVGLYSYDVFKNYLEAENDTIYVVNFWATWCKPCVEELPSFEELYQNYKNKKVRLILVSLDFEKQIESKLIPFMDKHKLKGEVLVLKQKGMNNWIDKIDPSWSGALPATIIYNKNKRAFFEQSFDYEELEEKLQEFL
jgi:thiol-disulfide isomerase/thioredoxin